MPKVYEFLANGFEEIEGLAPVDILRRGGVDVKTVSITGDLFVETSHGVTVKADIKFEDVADLKPENVSEQSVLRLWFWPHVVFLMARKQRVVQVLSVISRHQQPILASSFKSMETLQRVKVRRHLYHIPIHF